MLQNDLLRGYCEAFSKVFFHGYVRDGMCSMLRMSHQLRNSLHPMFFWELPWGIFASARIIDINTFHSILDMWAFGGNHGLEDMTFWGEENDVVRDAHLRRDRYGYHLGKKCSESGKDGHWSMTMTENPALFHTFCMPIFPFFSIMTLVQD